MSQLFHIIYDMSVFQSRVTVYGFMLNFILQYQFLICIYTLMYITETSNL
jgi:hypothetical protein